MPGRSTLHPVKDWTSWLNESVAEEMFRYVDTMKHGVPLKQLDIKRARPQPKLLFYNGVMLLDHWCIYSCWRTSSQVHVIRLPSKVEDLTRRTVQDVYEQPWTRQDWGIRRWQALARGFIEFFF